MKGKDEIFCFPQNNSSLILPALLDEPMEQPNCRLCDGAVGSVFDRLACFCSHIIGLVSDPFVSLMKKELLYNRKKNNDLRPFEVFHQTPWRGLEKPFNLK